MLTFVRAADGRPEAQSGKHDDCVMALAIAYAIRGQQSMVPQICEETNILKKVSKDIEADYYKIPPMERHAWALKHGLYGKVGE